MSQLNERIFSIFNELCSFRNISNPFKYSDERYSQVRTQYILIMLFDLIINRLFPQKNALMTFDVIILNFFFLRHKNIIYY
jgi:hypothetical protein